MSRTKALEKVKLTSFDDLFGGKETEKAAEAGDVREIPLSELHEFHNHPFRIRFDEELAEISYSEKEKSIRKYRETRGNCPRSRSCRFW